MFMMLNLLAYLSHTLINGHLVGNGRFNAFPVLQLRTDVQGQVKLRREKRFEDGQSSLVNVLNYVLDSSSRDSPSKHETPFPFLGPRRYLSEIG